MPDMKTTEKTQIRSRKNRMKWVKKLLGESSKKAYICRGIAILCVAFLLGGIYESLYELNVYRKSLKGGNEAVKTVISDENIEVEHFLPENAAEDTEKLQRFHITIKERYINKLTYHYQSEEHFVPNIKIHTKNVYKNPEVREIKDICRSNLNQSVMNIKDYVTEIFVEAPANVEISEFTIDNTRDFNWYRLFYAAVFVALILILVLFRKEIGRKIEYGFVVVCLGCGLLFIAIQPPECVSWDEHIHFNKVFDWFDIGETPRSQSEYYMLANPQSAQRSAFLSREEKQMQVEYLNENTDNMVLTFVKGRNLINPLNNVGEVHMGVAVKLASMMHLPFYAQFVIGKLANLLLYVLVMFWAIRILPIGKKFFTVIALTPTAMLQSVSFTYDVVLIGFTGLGFALIIAEFFDLGRKFTWKRAFLIASIFVIGTCPKPVYIPLLALLLALPKEKFVSKKQMVLFKCGAVLICGAMLMTMLLPAATGGVQGDSRGGATNVTQQLSLVMHHPFAYIRVFFDNFKRTFNNYLFGRENVSYLAYAGIHPFDSMIGIFCVGVALTEKKRKFVFTRKDKNLVQGIIIRYYFWNHRFDMVGALYCIYTGWFNSYRRCAGKIFHTAVVSDIHDILYG